ncbi:hypothetical protein Pint_18635 [Pistacia integerrima]|uniref:Uncharacterized protein n=1 Tax=Pistacia integerrima TaxID=434235 RepID=A0ACC0YXF3_9ROSI|nr:hypothetical protein Pint_18635 [Pistacia integerrima]
MSVLESGLIWRIGDGSKARIWIDKWLPFASSFKIQSQCLEVNIICRIPISIFSRLDKIVWRCSQNGLFSVRSAYHLQVESQISSRGQSSSAANEHKKWKKLWKLPITNVEKLFLWKACQDILPTKCNLVKKMVIEEPFCPFGCLEEEDVLHALWGVVAAKDIWSSCSLTFQKMNNNFTDFRELVMVLLSKFEEKYLAEFGVVVSKIWQRRNEFTFKHYLSTPSQLIHHVTQELDILKSLLQSKTSPNAHLLNSDPSSPKWQPPPEGIFKVNWDASVRKENGTIGIGIAIRDWQGRASNVIAHTLAKDALTIDDVLVELEEVPNCIGSLVDPIE